MDIFEDRNEIVVRAELPGIKQEDIDIELTGDTLTLKGERKFEDAERKDSYVRMERSYGEFQRSFTIGVPVQHDDVRRPTKTACWKSTCPSPKRPSRKKVKVTAS